MLKHIYSESFRSVVFHKETYGAKVTNLFIDDTTYFENIIEHIVQPLGIDRQDVCNLWAGVDPEYKCNGINFNIITKTDFLRPHRDYNPTKLNILISGPTINGVHFTDNGESWFWETPAIIDVSKEHYLTNIPEEPPRITLQIFLTKPIEYYRSSINFSPNW
jgi:hypothetical protein